MNKIKRIFRRIRTLLWTALTLLTVLAAVVVGIGKLLMPYSVYYQPELEAWLSKAFNQPVTVESFTGEWKAFGPRISLQGVMLKPDGTHSDIAINKAALDIKPLNALIPGRPLYSFRIIGADLSLERAADGRYVLSGLGVGNTGPDEPGNSGLRDVALNGEVRLQDISLTFDDPEREIHIKLRNVNGRLKMDGRRLAAEIQASLTDRERQMVIGDIDAIVKVKLSPDQHLAQAQWHIKTGELMLSELVRQLPHHPLVPVSGRLNAEVWGEWQSDTPQHIQGVLDLREAQLNSQTGPLLLEHLNSRFNFRFTRSKDWRLDMSDLTVEYAGEKWQSEKFSLARNISRNLGLWVSADLLELDYPLQLTQKITANYNTVWPAGIPRRAQGRVSDFDLVLDAGWQVKMARGQLDDGHFWGWDKGPDLEGINARFELESGEGNISFDGTSVRLDWSHVFRRPIIVSLDECRLELLWANKADWHFDLNYCRVMNKDLAVTGGLRMASSDGKPVVDINVAMERGDISRFGDYWPQNVMSDRTLHWLRTSLLGGQVLNGRYSMKGDMDDFPFKNQNGRIQAIVEIDDAYIKYVDKWPAARKIDAVALFEGPGMSVEGTIGDISGAQVEWITATIDDFKDPLLDVEYRSSADLPELIGFIRQSPLLDEVALDPDQFVFAGPAEIYGHIHSRLGQAEEQLQVTGDLELKGNRFTDLASGVILDGITGVLNYDRSGLKATSLPASYKDFPVTLDIISKWDSDEVFRARLHGYLPAEKVIPEELLQREPLFSHVSGNSRWDVGLSVNAVEGQKERDIWLEIYSGLEGVTIDLPAPLHKDKGTSRPMLVRYPVRTKNMLVTADFLGEMQLAMELSMEDSSPVRAAVELGGKVENLPAPGLFAVGGSTAKFDLDGWVDLAVERFSGQQEADGLSLETASINAGQVRVFDRQFENVGLQMSYEDGIINGAFDGQDLNGNVRYYKNEQGAHSMSGEFERLIMPDALAEGLTMQTDPSELPEMHFYSKEFSYLGIALGETRIEAYPVKDGFHIESIEARSASLIFSARGDWLRDDLGDRSDFEIRITSESLGTVLEAMDISSAMQGGQTLVHFDAWWPGPPAAFALERLNGEMDFSVIQGNILTANAGAGRMLGLLSLTELPRRLAMDFRDVFDEGFAFDEAKGTMQLENGTSYTNDMSLSSTVADINITGSTDLVGQTFDYEFVVRPGVSKTLPVIGAIAGGPVGAAAGLALQAIFREALGEAAEARYTIRGPWEDPQVEAVNKVPKQRDSGNAPVSVTPDGKEDGIQLDKEAGVSDQQSTDENNHE